MTQLDEGRMASTSLSPFEMRLQKLCNLTFTCDNFKSSLRRSSLHRHTAATCGATTFEVVITWRKKSVRDTGGSRLDSAPHAPCAETVYQPSTTRPCHGGISRLPMRTRQAIVLETYRRDKGPTSGQLWFRLIYFVLHNPFSAFFSISLYAFLRKERKSSWECLIGCLISHDPYGHLLY